MSWRVFGGGELQAVPHQSPVSATPGKAFNERLTTVKCFKPKSAMHESNWDHGEREAYPCS